MNTRRIDRIDADGSTHDVPIAALAAGDRVLVRPGAKVPVDGAIIEGGSAFNEAMLTGESRPVSKSVGQAAIGGAINGAGAGSTSGVEAIRTVAAGDGGARGGAPAVLHAESRQAAAPATGGRGG